MIRLIPNEKIVFILNICLMNSMKDFFFPYLIADRTNFLQSNNWSIKSVSILLVQCNCFTIAASVFIHLGLLCLQVGAGWALSGNVTLGGVLRIAVKKKGEL